jgi:hypothetical protein
VEAKCCASIVAIIESLDCFADVDQMHVVHQAGTQELSHQILAGFVASAANINWPAVVSPALLWSTEDFPMSWLSVDSAETTSSTQGSRHQASQVSMLKRVGQIVFLQFGSRLPFADESFREFVKNISRAFVKIPRRRETFCWFERLLYSSFSAAMCCTGWALRWFP